MHMPVELDQWMTRLEARHLANLQFSEVSRALRALSSAYVERRHTAIAAGKVLDTVGKRAAFALYYGPLHFVAATRILESLPVAREVREALPVLDLGCGTGAVGAAVAAWTGTRRIHGLDVHPWTLDEARATYANFGLDATLTRANVARLRQPGAPSFIVAGYVVNELPDAERERLLRNLMAAVGHGSQLLVIEPLSGQAAPWWPAWVETFATLGARADTWHLTISPPDLTMKLGQAAGLTPTSVKARTIAVLPARRRLGEGGRS
jgi:2-polyprenyl-3-methyl-5-hydroxy-6-metoxy-1,4-benzoquinol methylase